MHVWCSDHGYEAWETPFCYDSDIQGWYCMSCTPPLVYQISNKVFATVALVLRDWIIFVGDVTCVLTCSYKCPFSAVPVGDTPKTLSHDREYILGIRTRYLLNAFFHHSKWLLAFKTEAFANVLLIFKRSLSNMSWIVRTSLDLTVHKLESELKVPLII